MVNCIRQAGFALDCAKLEHAPPYATQKRTVADVIRFAYFLRPVSTKFVDRLLTHCKYSGSSARNDLAERSVAWLYRGRFVPAPDKAGSLATRCIACAPTEAHPGAV